MGVFEDAEAKNTLMDKKVSLDEILEEERRIVQDQASEEIRNRASRPIRTRYKSSRTACQNPYDAFASPAYAPASKPIYVDARMLTSQHAQPAMPAAPKDEFEAAALAAYYSTYSRALQSKRRSDSADTPYDSHDHFSRRRRSYDSYGGGEREVGRQDRNKSNPRNTYAYNTGARESKTTPAEVLKTLKASVPSAATPQFLLEPQRRPASTDVGSDSEVVCIGQLISGGVPPTPKIQSAIPILIIDDDDAPEDAMLDT